MYGSLIPSATWYLVFWGILTFIVSGCVSSNIEWVQKQQIKYTIMVLPEKEWSMASAYHKLDPQVLCAFIIPETIIVRWDVPIDSCQEHEIGHLREYLEREPIHSGKYTIAGQP